MLKRFQGFFSHDLCVDLGTANTLIHLRGQGIVLDEPSVMAVRQEANSHGERGVAAVGEDAKKMLGRTPGDIKTVRPLKEGVVADFTVTEKMLQHFTRKVHRTKLLKPSPRMLMTTPCGATEVERRALREAGSGAGAREVYLMEEPLAAALGAGLPVSEPCGSMVVDIGGGTSEVAVLSLNGIVYSESLRVGGYHMDEAIINYVRRNHGSTIGEATAERVKFTIGAAYPQREVMEMTVHGFNVAELAPRRFVINSNEVLEALQDPLRKLVSAVMRALEGTPPELGADLAERGMVLTGGGALLRGLDQLLMEETRMPVRVADDPLSCVARGGGMVLEQMDTNGASMLLAE
ncbi:MAG: rod shape-determining protein [Gammaproteobacteria bacterium]|nr:rod shape-determining protein [Gammaproteobacteria bacterium]